MIEYRQKKLIKKNPKNNSFVLLDKPKNLFSGVLCFCLYNNKNTHRNYYNTHICNKEKIYISTISTYRGLILLFLPYLLEFYRIFFFFWKKWNHFFWIANHYSTEFCKSKKKEKFWFWTKMSTVPKFHLMGWRAKNKIPCSSRIFFFVISMTTIWKNSTR